MSDAQRSRGFTGRRAAGLLALAVSAALILTFALAPAAQASSGGILGYFDEDFQSPRGIVVNETGNGPDASVGDLYIVDEDNGGGSSTRIVEINPTGSPIRAFGWGVANGSNEYQVCTANCQGAILSNPPDQPGDLGHDQGAIAIDQSNGNLFVISREQDRINIFSADGRFEGAFGFGVTDGASHLEFCTTTCHQGGSGEGAGEWRTPYSLAVDPTTGDLYLTDLENHRVDEFSLSLNGSQEVTGVSFIQAFGWGVENGAPEFQTCTTASGCQAGLNGQGVGEFGAGDNPGYPPHFTIAVNSVGVVYVVDREEATLRVESFTPLGSSYVPTVFDPAVLSTSSTDSGAEDLTIAPNGTIIAVAGFPEEASTCPGGIPPYSLSELRVLVLSPAGTLLGTDGACADIFNYGGGVAFNPSTETAYLIGRFKAGNGFEAGPESIFALGVDEPPKPTITGVVPNAHGAFLTATINSEGPPPGGFPNPPPVTYQTEYKKSDEPTWSDWGRPIPVSGVQSVAPHLGGLEADTLYEVRLSAHKGYKYPPSYGGDAVPDQPAGVTGTTQPQLFTTLRVPPSIEGDSASEVTATSAVLDAAINPHGTATSFHFEYGTTTNYGHLTPETNIGESLTGQKVKVQIEDLESKVYHFRVIAHNAEGTATSEDQTFNFYPSSCPNQKLRALTGASSLPDCRAYELVSPPESHGAIIFPNSVQPNSPTATNPSRFGFNTAFVGMPGTGQPITGVSKDLYVSTRTDNGWVTKYVGVRGDETNEGHTPVGNAEMSKFLSFNQNPETAGYSPAPYLYNYEDELLGHWPSDVRSPYGENQIEGAMQPSADFSHLAFSSESVDFTAGQGPGKEGLTTAPGSMYDFSPNENTTTLISKTANGEDIGNSSEYIQFPVFDSGGEAESPPRTANGPVSSNGTHILMATSGGALYMRVDDASTYEVSDGKDVNYVGMTPDGSKVFFTSNEQLTPEDKDSSTDLYMWSEATGTLKDISIGNNGGGNSDTCDAEWISGCDIAPVDTSLVEFDSSIAAETGEIYFYSPEQLDGTKGIEGLENLYVYRHGEDRFVATFDPGSDCIPFGILPHCSVGPIDRVDVAPSGEYVAFLTSSPLTSYDNIAENGVCDKFYGGGQDGPRCEEMYRYAPATETLKCVSCNPTNAPPVGDVSASYDGLFMTNDGRTFFYTPDSLVAQDTNEAEDVYEYVDGRPQLITSGTGTKDVLDTGNQERRAGLMGVSANGLDVYFATYEGLVPQDKNGQFERIYDARSDGGFPSATEGEPCAAAEECHGPGSEAPAPFLSGTEGDFGNAGNATATARRPRHSRAHRHSHRHRARRRSHHRTQEGAAASGSPTDTQRYLHRSSR